MPYAVRIYWQIYVGKHWSEDISAPLIKVILIYPPARLGIILDSGYVLSMLNDVKEMKNIAGLSVTLFRSPGVCRVG